MKRKRGHKKSKKSNTKETSLTAPADANSLGDTVMSENTNNDDSNMDKENENEPGMEVDKVNTPSSTGTDKPLSVVIIKPIEPVVEKPIVKSYSRVKVRLKTSKILEPEVPARSSDNTDKSGSIMVSERQGNGVAEKMEDCANSLAELKKGDSGNASGGTKGGCIKIKSSSASSLRVLSASSIDKSSNTGLEEGCVSVQQKEPKIIRPEYRYSKQELDAALNVIKKIMKMDAAEPFNVPVNPVALGIPDYFDVIDTPMDFGTVCSNLESGDKYKNSEDVFKDVQYIWDNCFKYNNKGDYILDLMRRVKKNFMKYWAGAGLYYDQSKGGELESGQGKVKGDPLKQKKRPGRRHKSDCMCAICVLKRKKREREAQEAQMARGVVGYHGQELKQEVSTPTGSPDGEDSSSNTDESMDEDADGEVQGKGEHVKGSGSEQRYINVEMKREGDEERKHEGENATRVHKGDGETNEQIENRSEQEPNGQSQMGLVGKPDSVGQTNSQSEQNSRLPDEETVSVQQQKQKESEERLQRAKLYETFQFQNPNLLNLCGILFPEKRKSVWSGPHSLVKHEGRPSRTSSIHKAVDKILS